MTRLPWILGLGGGAAALYFGTRGRGLSASSTSSPRPSSPVLAGLEGQWVWPVPSWRGRAPVISDGFDSPRPGVPRHGAVDIMFPRVASDTALPPGTPNGSKGFVMPDRLPALAASDGVVWSAMQTPRGFAVVIDHGKRGSHHVATFYTHLDRLLVQPTARAASNERVRAGQPLGTIGFDPTGSDKLMHLHFELWLGGPSDRIDPTTVMRGWKVTPTTEPVLVARNAGFTYRPIGARGESYPSWIRELKGRSGVYLIRDADSHELLYVGSSSRRLYETLTRHFQTWRRFKGFWSGQYAEGHDPGLTYDRARVEVAIRFTGPDDSLDEESRLIHRLQPRDNLLGQPTEEDVPF